MMRAQLPDAEHSEPAVFVGPSVMVLKIVRATLANVVAALNEFAASRSRTPETRPQLRELGAAVDAWTQTYVDCLEVEAYNFDRAADPATAW